MIKSLSNDTVLFNNQQVRKSNPKVLPSHYSMDILKMKNKTISPINFNCDIFEKQPETVKKQGVYIDKQGKKYDIKGVIKCRLEDLSEDLLENQPDKPNNMFSKIVNFVKETFNIGNTYKKYKSSIMKSFKIIDNTKDISELFFKLTGYKYNDNNIEKFLVGDIKLKSEIIAEKYTGKKIDVISSPYISKYYVSKNTLDELKNSRTKLNKKEFKKYNAIKNLLPKDYQQKLSNVLNNGQLLQDNSEGNITILSSLHKIATEDRADKIDNLQLLKDCIDILDNPYTITQHAENIPEEYQNEFAERLVTSEITKQKNLANKSKVLLNDKSTKSKMPKPQSINRNEIKKRIIDGKEDFVFQYRSLGTCAATSLEFDLATQHPAEFFRIVEGLTSKNKTISKNIDNNDYNESQLKLFKTPHKTINKKQTAVVISADDNAYLLAEIQNKYKDEQERSIIDIIMQSAIMNLGSRQTYNSINDTRKPNEYTSDDRGLINMEISFVKEILTNKKTFNNTYKNINNNGIVSDLYKKQNIKNELLRALQQNNNIVVGIIYTDKNNQCIGGHELTVIGYTTNLKGQGFFIVQDSDDDQQKPITIPENELLKQIHHANL